MPFYKIALAVLAMGIFGFNAVVSKIGLQEFSPLLFNLLRFIVVFPCLFFIARPAISWSLLAAIAGTLSIGHLSFANIGLALGASPGTYVLIQQTGSLFAIFFAYVLLGHRPSKFDLAGITLGTIGVYWICVSKGTQGNFWAIIFMLASACTWALGYILIKKADAESLGIVSWTSIFAIPCLCISSGAIEGVEEIFYSLSNASPIAWSAVLYSGWISMLGAGGILAYLMRTEPIAKVVPYYLLVPLFGCLFSALLLGEELHQATIVGGLCILGGLVVVRFGPSIFFAAGNFFKKVYVKGGIMSVLMGMSLSAQSENTPAQYIDVAIIGGGCAGLSAALVTAEYDFQTCVFMGPKPGGALNEKTIVGNWPGKQITYGDTIIEELQKQAQKFGAHLIDESIVMCDLTTYPFAVTSANGDRYLAAAVLIATGTSERKLEAENCQTYLSKGIFSNTMVYKNWQEFQDQAKNSTSLVIGGGVDAVKKAIYLCRAGAAKVFMAFRGENLNVSPLRKKMLDSYSQIEFIPEAKVQAFLGDGTKLHAVLLAANEDQVNVPLDCAVISVGRVPNTQLFKNTLKLDEKEAIMLQGATQQTTISGVFAAGDATTAQIYGQAAIAAGDGMKAGYEIINFLKAQRDIKRVHDESNLAYGHLPNPLLACKHK